MSFGTFNQAYADAQKMMARYAEWEAECAAWWAAHPDAEVGDDICEELPECPLSTAAHMGAQRTIELHDTVYSRLTDEDMALIATYPAYCPNNVQPWKALKDKYGLSWNELRALLISMMGVRA